MAAPARQSWRTKFGAGRAPSAGARTTACRRVVIRHRVRPWVPRGRGGQVVARFRERHDPFRDVCANNFSRRSQDMPGLRLQAGVSIVLFDFVAGFRVDGTSGGRCARWCGPQESFVLSVSNSSEFGAFRKRCLLEYDAAPPTSLLREIELHYSLITIRELCSMETTIVIPARNEAGSVGGVVAHLREALPDAEILVVDDGSADETAAIAEKAGARVIRHVYGMGNGAAVKTGIREAKGETVVLMDADGQHDPGDVKKLINMLLHDGYDMVVGARDAASQASVARDFANRFYNRLASYMTGQEIVDLTSGFRAVNARKFRQFLYLLPNGFSYPTTITMAFFRAGYAVGYLPITASKRIGKSHISPVSDGLRFLVIIFRIGTLYSPLKIFVPFSFTIFLIGVSYYLYTFVTAYRFTNMSMLLITTSVVIFLMGLVSEQITALMYQRDTESNR